jgi:ABC-type glycerol-3-phosphate transport system permease component
VAPEAENLNREGAQGRRLVQMGLVALTQTGCGAPWGLFMAYAMVAFAPVLILFLGLQRWFVSGLTSGGLKG